ncbi:hypothetical protein GCM10007905_34270 [Mixta theicola]|nr:hypothetical protein GCM10007905_34270 [Mixta theicola]
MPVQSAFPEDGNCTQTLINSICHFQLVHLRFKHPDGIIEPSGKTFYALAQKALSAPAYQSPPLPYPQKLPKLTQAQLLVNNYLRRFGCLINSSELSKLSLKASRINGSASLTEDDYINAVSLLNNKVEKNIIKAFAIVESGGRSGFNEQNLPVIAFEGHVFRKYTNRFYDFTHPNLSYPYSKKAAKNWRRNNKNQASSWQTLSDAFDLSSEAALKSCSWGMFQIMGFNYKSTGYDDIYNFVKAMKENAGNHLRSFLNFCSQNPALLSAMQKKDFVSMAANYNGMDYGDYDQRIKHVYETLSKK